MHRLACSLSLQGQLLLRYSNYSSYSALESPCRGGPRQQRDATPGGWLVRARPTAQRYRTAPATAWGTAFFNATRPRAVATEPPTSARLASKDFAIAVWHWGEPTTVRDASAARLVQSRHRALSTHHRTAPSHRETKRRDATRPLNRAVQTSGERTARHQEHCIGGQRSQLQRAPEEVSAEAAAGGPVTRDSKRFGLSESARLSLHSNTFASGDRVY
ncbi:hypothetical protein NDU88_004789 [Pleurodeles waltl]|uniref:Uncharacterized protein n=1 Tax=Pleurodeles waltl TaxID=8319 RepID=A0AAV7L7P7_PLEWA|nr:hypothetical protein NDU88_004789 [Pleurodeles waltl]